ncbi:COBRA, plant [Sesbania bispinosa]|nr:COBRA, plant [Sesbania bispinosa]
MNPFSFIDQRSMANILIFIFFSIIVSISPSYGYDPLDPLGNITIKWDFLADNGDTVDCSNCTVLAHFHSVLVCFQSIEATSPRHILVKVSIYNLQLFRHVEEPGWKLGWAWRGNEEPVIIDLMPGTPYNLQTANCCKGGVLTSITQDLTKYGATFQMNYAKSSHYIPGASNFSMPENFTLGIPGYSCGTPFQVPPTKFTKDGHRWQQVLETWNVTCIYSQFLASPAPKCCVSLSSFYNSSIVPCPHMQLVANCHKAHEAETVVRCTHHMCPIRVHWHVKQSYKEYWRVKITITNLNLVKNYSQWNLVVYTLTCEGADDLFLLFCIELYHQDDTGMFWGLEYYNDLLLAHGDNGKVQTEVLLHKDRGEFTFKEGWTFPRKISFNGDECVMPSPDAYPRLPNTAMATTTTTPIIFFSSMSLAILSILV